MVAKWVRNPLTMNVLRSGKFKQGKFSLDANQASDIEAFFKSHGLNYTPQITDIDRGYVNLDVDQFRGVIVITSHSWGFEAGIRDYRKNSKIVWGKFGGYSLSRNELKALRIGRADQEQRMSEAHHRVKDFVQLRLKQWADTIFEPNYLQPQSPYLTNKKLTTPSGMIVRGDENSNRRILCVPMIDASGEVWNVQSIWPEGQKYYWSRGRTKGLFSVIQGANGPSRVLLGEGFATCLAANQASGLTVYCAFGASNMESVVRVMLDRYRPEQIVLLVDFDARTEAQTGVNKGLQTCAELSLKYRLSFALPYPGISTSMTEKNVDCADVWADRPEELTKALSEDHIFPWEMAVDFIVRPRPPVEAEPVEVESPVEPEIIQEAVVELVEPVATLPVVINYDWINRPPIREVTNRHNLKPSLLPDRKGDEGKGAVMGTLQNFEVLMSHIGATLRYNVIAKREEWFVAGVEASLDNYEKVLYAEIQDACARVGFPDDKIGSYLSRVCDKNQFNPVAAWIESKPWDGTSRLNDLFQTVGVEKDAEKLRDTFIRKWLIMAVAAAYEPMGIKAPGMLVFQGPQFIGKTKWLMSLTPPELRLAKEGVVLDVRDKDTVREAITHWLVELGELDGTLKRSEQASLKAWLTKSQDIIRSPYAKASNSYPRRTVFFGSVNEENFLTDKTGNRRYWVIGLKSLKHDFDFDTQQLWAEVLTLYRGGEVWWPTGDQMALMNESNEQFTEIDPLEELLQSTYDWTEHGSDMTATELCNDLMISEPSKWQTNLIATLARKLSGGLRPTCLSRKAGRKLWVGQRRTKSSGTKS